MCWAGRGLGVTGRGERTRRANGSCGLAVWGRAQRRQMVPASGRLCGRRARQGTLAAPLALKSHTSASSCVSGASRTTGPPREPRVGAPGGWCTGPLRGRPGFRRSPSPPRDRIRARRHGRMRGLCFPARVARCGAGSSCSFWGDPALLGGPQRSALPMLAQGLWSRLRPTAARGAPRVLSSGASH